MQALNEAIPDGKYPRAGEIRHLLNDWFWDLYDTPSLYQSSPSLSLLALSLLVSSLFSTFSFIPFRLSSSFLTLPHSGSQMINCTDRDKTAPQHEWKEIERKREEKKKKREERKAEKALKMAEVEKALKEAAEGVAEQEPAPQNA